MHCCAFVSVGVPAEFTVFTKEAGEGDVDVRVIDNNGKKVPVDIKDNKDGTYTIIYYPTTVGSYSVNVTFNSESIPKSPFKVNVCQTNSAACRAYGPGLEKVTKKFSRVSRKFLHRARGISLRVVFLRGGNFRVARVSLLGKETCWKSIEMSIIIISHLSLDVFN